MLRELSPFREFKRQLTRLGFRRDLAGQEQPKHTFGDDLLTTRRWGQLALAFRNTQSMESDTLS